MSDWQEIFELRDDADGPGDDFETRVFAKIRSKKRQRKIGIGITAVAATALFLVLFQPFRPLSRPLPLADSVKEEVPVSEDLYFSASDSRTRYSLEAVSYGKRASQRQAAPNQI